MSSYTTSTSSFGIARRAPPLGTAEHTALAALIGISWYNALELIVLCFITFKRYGGLYFWCLLIASFSIIPFGLGYLLIIYNIYDNLFSVTMELIAWVGMVTGQSLVLWSRLHLVMQNRKVLRATLAMIIIDAIILHVPASVLELGSHSNKSSLFSHGFNIFEDIQLIGFSIQEVILSVIYSMEAVRMLHLRPRGHYRGILVQLLVVNIFMIAMDAAVIAVQFAGMPDVQFCLKAMVYSIKLKLEYAILNKLVVFAEKMTGSNSNPTDISDFVDLSFHPDPRPSPPADSDSQARIMRDMDYNPPGRNRTPSNPTNPPNQDPHLSISTIQTPATSHDPHRSISTIPTPTSVTTRNDFLA